MRTPAILIAVSCLIRVSVALGQTGTPIENASTAYLREERAAADELLKQLEIAIRRAEGKPALRAALMTLQDEKTRFEERGWIPWSAPMRKHSFDYLRRINLAREKLTAIYEGQVESLARGQQINEAEGLRTKLKELIEPEIVAEWSFLEGDRTDRLQLRSDGTRADKKGATWTMRPDGFMIKFQRWTTICVVSEDGTTFVGKSNQGQTPTGRLLIEESPGDSQRNQ
ncbi:MAG: hypothetical protein KDA80_20370 [Planctomycetaceae bacterium]|nr:hypothetical protein [Planctomycetaceae bacterium]